MEAIKISDEYRRVFTTPNNNKYFFNKSGHRKYLNNTKIGKIVVMDAKDIADWSLDINYNNKKRMNDNLDKKGEDVKATIIDSNIYPIMEHNNKKMFVLDDKGNMIRITDKEIIL